MYLVWNYLKFSQPNYFEDTKGFFTIFSFPWVCHSFSIYILLVRQTLRLLPMSTFSSSSWFLNCTFFSDFPVDRCGTQDASWPIKCEWKWYSLTSLDLAQTYYFPMAQLEQRGLGRRKPLDGRSLGPQITLWSRPPTPNLHLTLHRERYTVKSHWGFGIAYMEASVSYSS